MQFLKVFNAFPKERKGFTAFPCYFKDLLRSLIPREVNGLHKEFNAFPKGA